MNQRTIAMDNKMANIYHFSSLSCYEAKTRSAEPDPKGPIPSRKFENIIGGS